jgi:hypothetical protein
MSKADYNNFKQFDLNEACDYFDSEDQKQWKKINKFVVADGQDYVNIMEQNFNFEDTTDDEYAAFDAGVKYAMTKAAGVKLEVQEVDLIEAMGFLLVRANDKPETFVKRVLEKPTMQIESWA